MSNFIGPSTWNLNGSVRQVVSTNFAGTFSTNSGSWTDITGFNLTITPSSSSSKILLLLQVSAGASDFLGLIYLEGLLYLIMGVQPLVIDNCLHLVRYKCIVGH